MAYESFVGQRYLMAKQRSRVVSIITLIAVGGVALGVTALIVVLSVMGGFTEDLTDKILGARAHIVVQDEHVDPIRNPDDIAEEAMTVDGIEGAAPFIESEVMVSSPTNLSGVILRGVDVDRVKDVSDLLDEIQEGRLEYLVDDTELMDEVEDRREREVNELLDRLDDERRDLDGSPPPPELVDGDDDAAPDSNSDDDEPALPDLPEEDPETDDPSNPPPLPDMEDDEAAMELPTPVDEQLGPEPPDGADIPGFDAHPGDSAPPELPMFDDMDPADGPAETVDDGPRDPRVPGIIIGTELATSLNVELGDEVNVVTPRGEMGPTGPIPRSRPFRVVGVFYSGMYEYDANHAYTAFDDAGRLLDQDGATGVELRAYDVDASVELAEQLREVISPDLNVLDWQELNSSLFFALRLERIAMFVILTFIILVASFSIVAMLIMIVIEKAREIAILKSMGSSNGDIMRIFMYQGVVIGTLGAILGLGAGLGICYFLTTVGLPLDSEVYYISKLPVAINPVEIAAVVVCAIFISFLATLYPSYKAAGLNPVKGLRYE